MPDFGAPIAQDVNVSPQQGIQTISGILGLKQQQQQLQTQTAQAQMATQQQQELKNLSTFTSNAITDPSYRNADGSPNVQKFQAGAMAVAPVFGQQYIGQMTGAFNGQVDNRKALLGLANEQRQTASGYLGAFSADPRNIPGSPQYDPTGVDNRYLDSIEQARSVSDDPGYQRALDSMLMHSPSTAQLPTDQAARTRASLAKVSSTVVANPMISSADLAQQARTTAVGAGAPNAGLSAPAVSMVQGPKGLVPTNINPMSPGGVGPVGPTQAQGMSPSERYSIQPAPSGQLILTDRQTGRAYSLSAGAVGAPAPTQTGQSPKVSPASGPARIGYQGNQPLTSDNDPQKPGANDPQWRQGTYGTSVAQAQHDVLAAQQQDANYGTNMQTANMIRQYSNSTQTGPGTTGWTRFLGTIGTRLGAQNVADTQTLASFLDLQSTRLRDSMGLPATNAGLATSQEMGTSIESQRSAIQAKTDYYQALTDLNHIYRQGLDAAGNGGVNPSPTSVSAFKHAFTSNADPVAVEIKLALARGDSASAQKLLQGLSPQQRQLLAQHGRNLDLISQGQLPQ